MLIYHPAYDIYHTSYRILSILANENNRSLEIDRVRLYDFILLFPHDLKNIRLPVGTGAIRKKYNETSYNRLPSRKKVYNQIKSYFDLSAHCLISYGALDLKSYQEGFYCKGEKFYIIAEQLRGSMERFDIELMKYFSDVFSKIPIGQLKQRFQYN